MTDLLTRAEYKALAADLAPPRTAFIDGKYRAGSGPKFTTINPPQARYWQKFPAVMPVT